MAHGLHSSWRPGRALALFSVLLAAAVLTLPSPAQPPKTDPPANKDVKGDDKAQPQPPRQKIISSFPSDTANDVPDVVGIINTRLEDGWSKNKLTPSRPATDHEFIRRATLDIIGRVAKPEEIDEFLRDPAQYRRTKLIDRLLSSSEYPRHWANLWTNWLLSRSGAFGRGRYHEDLATWLEDQFATNRRFDEITRELIAAKGTNNTLKNYPVNFILAHVGEPVPQDRRAKEGQFDMVPITSRITRLFLGVQTQCTQCHDHPFDAKLRQKHFWGINVFLRQIERQGTPPNMMQMNTFPDLTLTENTRANQSGAIEYEKRNGVFLQTKADFFGKRIDTPKENRRDELASLVLASDNYPRALVNRMWSVFFGKGFTNPVDDFNEQNPPSNPELLEELGKKYRHYSFDQKKLIRWICNSEAYSLSCVANKTNDKPEHEVFFSRMLIKSMSPEQMFESLMVSTQTDSGKDEQKEQRDRWLRNLVQNFGDDEGNEVNFNGTVVQALLMMNGEDINKAINSDKGLVAKVLKDTKFRTDFQKMNHLYLATLNRPLTQREFSLIVEKMALRPQFQKIDSVNARYQDLLWALVNSNEFILNH